MAGLPPIPPDNNDTTMGERLLTEFIRGVGDGIRQELSNTNRILDEIKNQNNRDDRNDNRDDEEERRRQRQEDFEQRRGRRSLLHPFGGGGNQDDDGRGHPLLRAVGTLVPIAGILAFLQPVGIAMGALYLLFKNIGDPRVKDTIVGIASLWDTAILPIFESMKESFMILKDTAFAGLQATIESFRNGEYFTGVGQLVAGIAQGLKDAAMNLIIDFAQAFNLTGIEDAAQFIKDLDITGLITTAISKLELPFNILISTIDNIFGTLTDTVTDIIDAIKTKDPKEIVNATLGGLLDIGAMLVNAISIPIRAIIGYAVELIESAFDIDLSSIKETLINFDIKVVAGMIADIIKSGYDTIVAKFTGWKDTIVGFFTNDEGEFSVGAILENLFGAASVGEFMANTIDGFFRFVAGTIMKFFGVESTDEIEAALENFSFTEMFIKPLGEKLDAAWTEITNWFNEFSFIEMFWNPIKDRLTKLRDSFMFWVDNRSVEEREAEYQQQIFELQQRRIDQVAELDKQLQDQIAKIRDKNYDGWLGFWGADSEQEREAMRAEELAEAQRMHDEQMMSLNSRHADAIQNIQEDLDLKPTDIKVEPIVVTPVVPQLKVDESTSVMRDALPTAVVRRSQQTAEMERGSVQRARENKAPIVVSAPSTTNNNIHQEQNHTTVGFRQPVVSQEASYRATFEALNAGGP